MPPKAKAAASDICLILEGTYPFTSGGVASWTHELIQMQKHLSFSIVALVAPGAATRLAYTLPSNVVSVDVVRLQSLPEGAASLPKGEAEAMHQALKEPLLHLQSQANLNDLAAIIKALLPHRAALGQHLLLDSPSSWELMLSMYEATLPKTSFLDYFWSWRGLFGGLYSVLLAPLPKAKTYHALCTGYAGLMLARARLETGCPCILTEHGIYTNERRIEIASADWLDNAGVFNLSVSTTQERELKDFWLDTFSNYSRLCYEACRHIITLYQGNQEFQRMDGADAGKLRVIPNGIDLERYGAIKRTSHPPTVALIGRVVPIKDIKTYIKAVHRLKSMLPELRAYMLGPTDEDPDYARECMEMVAHMKLEGTLSFTGKVDIASYLGNIDVIVLSSLSEAQPLVILEAGAAGIPTVATDVGACREMILGMANEQPALGAGGAVVPLSSPEAIAEALHKLLAGKEYYRRCSWAMAQRVRKYYSKADQLKSYAELYGELLETGKPQQKAA